MLYTETTSHKGMFHFASSVLCKAKTCPGMLADPIKGPVFLDQGFFVLWDPQGLLDLTVSDKDLAKIETTYPLYSTAKRVLKTH